MNQIISGHIQNDNRHLMTALDDVAREYNKNNAWPWSYSGGCQAAAPCLPEIVIDGFFH
jgi:hypothetical protein